MCMCVYVRGGYCGGMHVCMVCTCAECVDVCVVCVRGCVVCVECVWVLCCVCMHVVCVCVCVSMCVVCAMHLCVH